MNTNDSVNAITEAEIEEKMCHFFNKNNERECPSCGFTTIKGMPGGADSTCKQCGYKDPCCYDY